MYSRSDREAQEDHPSQARGHVASPAGSSSARWSSACGHVHLGTPHGTTLQVRVAQGLPRDGHRVLTHPDLLSFLSPAQKKAITMNEELTPVNKDPVQVPMDLLVRVANALGREPTPEHTSIRTELLQVLQDHRPQSTPEDTALLNWLDTQMAPVAEGQTYGDPYGEHVANVWSVTAQRGDVRSAIRDLMAQ